MSKDQLEAFSDGVIAILITIMVLELRTPHGTTWAALREDLPALLAYVLSFVYIGIYWNNHHHMLAAVSRVSGMALWANQHLLFWLSLIPAATAWMSQNTFRRSRCRLRRRAAGRLARLLHPPGRIAAHRGRQLRAGRCDRHRRQGQGLRPDVRPGASACRSPTGGSASPPTPP